MKYIACLFAIFLSGCSCYRNSPIQDTTCRVDSQTEFGRKLLTDARRITNDENTVVFGNCQEINELKAGQRTKLTTWRYILSLERAQNVKLEDLQLNR